MFLPELFPRLFLTCADDEKIMDDAEADVAVYQVTDATEHLLLFDIGPGDDDGVNGFLDLFVLGHGLNPLPRLIHNSPQPPLNLRGGLFFFLLHLI